jgi:hypothetical protein
MAEESRVRRLLSLLLRASRPFALDGIEARIDLRRAAIASLSGPRPRGVSAHALPVGPAGPVLERVVVAPQIAASAEGSWRNRSLHRLGECLVDGRTGLVLVDGRVVHESGSVGPDKRPKAQEWFLETYLTAVSRRGPHAAETIDRPIHHIGNIPSDNYYHWLIEVLPRILMVAEHDPSVLVLTPPLPTFAEEALDLLGIEHRVSMRPVVAASLLVVDPPESGRPHPHEVGLLESVGRRVLGTEGRPPERGRVYVSRRGGTRALHEEEMIEQHLAREGFTVFDPDSHPRWIDQVALFSGAELVVGPHGAGLVNAAFLPEGSHVIELRPDAYSAEMFEALCRARGVRYTSVPLPVEQGPARFGSAETALRLLEPLLRG